jgi:hypothetical protein
MHTTSNACAHTQAVCEGCAARRRTRPGDTETADVSVPLRSFRVLSSFDTPGRHRDIRGLGFKTQNTRCIGAVITTIYLESLSCKGGPKPESEQKTHVQKDFVISDRCKREYRQYRTWVEAGKWGLCVTPIGVRCLG